METVNIHCSGCGGLIGIRRPNLGQHVRCPLCQRVILATAPPAPADAAPSLAPEQSHQTPSFAPVPVLEHESIFTPAEASSDSLFGDSSSPAVEMPIDFQEEETRSPVSSLPAPAQTTVENGGKPEHGLPDAGQAAAANSLPEELVPARAPASLAAVNLPTGPHEDHPLASTSEPSAFPGNEPARPETPTGLENADGERTFLPAIRRKGRPTLLVPILLIFLIPYAILTTGFVVYLLWARSGQQKQNDPLERMLEENSKDGKPGIRRVQHDLPVPAKLRSGLKESLQVGAVEVRPLKVVRTARGDLVLYLQLRNTSEDLQFNPLPVKFTHYTRGTMAALKPYTFLEGGRQRIYGGVVQWWQGPEGKVKLPDGELRPGEVMIVRLVTDPQDRPQVAGLHPGRAGPPLLWRVQLRRGLEAIAGQDRVITCVVGVSFRPEQIEPS